MGARVWHDKKWKIKKRELKRKIKKEEEEKGDGRVSEREKIVKQVV